MALLTFRILQSKEVYFAQHEASKENIITSELLYFEVSYAKLFEDRIL